MKRDMLIIPIVLSFILLFATTSGAMMDVGLMGIGGKIGLVLPGEDESDSVLGMGVVANLGTILPILRAEASGEYWKSSRDEVSLSNISIGATLKYDFPFGRNLIPFIGGGAALAISRQKGTDAETSDTDTGMDMEFYVVGGVDIPIATIMNFTAEAKYITDDTDTIWLTGAFVIHLY